jgi:diguanylate cyclase (GGDEF)-like protein
MCDIDHFKAVNDRFGHHAGDLVLKELVARISRSIRYENDWVARYGGEEFVIVLPETPPAGCRLVAERFKAIIAGTPVPVLGASISVTVSFGAITVENTTRIEEMTMDVILGKADECLYRAKETGRNCVVAVQF